MRKSGGARQIAISERCVALSAKQGTGEMSQGTREMSVGVLCRRVLYGAAPKTYMLVCVALEKRRSWSWKKNIKNVWQPRKKKNSRRPLTMKNKDAILMAKEDVPSTPKMIKGVEKKKKHRRIKKCWSSSMGLNRGWPCSRFMKS